MIAPEQVGAYEAQGYTIVEIGPELIASRVIPPSDGDIQVQPKSDMLGRYAADRRYSNFGYSGYFRGYVYLDGKRRALVDWWTLFPNDEHHYASQREKGAAVSAIEKAISARAGTEVVKVRRGYSFNPVAYLERQTIRGHR